MKILETERVLLRRFQKDDIDSLYSAYCDPEVRKFIPDAPQSYKETQEELNYYLNGHPDFPEFGLWAAIDKRSGQFIGRCGLLPWVIDQQNEVELAYLIASEYRNQGLGTEIALAILRYGFDQLKLSRLVCLIEHENLASIKVAENIGMQFEKEGRDQIGPFLLYARNRPEG